MSTIINTTRSFSENKNVSRFCIFLFNPTPQFTKYWLSNLCGHRMLANVARKEIERKKILFFS